MDKITLGKRTIWIRFWFACFLGAVTSCLVLVWYVRQNYEPKVMRPVECVTQNYLVVTLPEELAKSVSSQRGVWLKLQVEK